MSYYEDVLASPAICSNCFGLKQIETDGGETLAYHPTSEVDYVPDTTASASRTTFCECGIQGAFDRTWTSTVPRRRFRELVKRCLAALERRGLEVDRVAFAKRALYEFDRRDTDQDVDAALAAGYRAGVSVSVSGPR